MDQKDIEVQVEVLRERQRVQANHLKDIDKICGNLKGASESEFQTLRERIVALEEHMDDNCHDVELEVATLREQVKINTQMVNSINSNLTKIKLLIYSTIIISIGGFMLK